MKINIPGYKIERELGKGSRATVYLALQEELDRHVALKILAPMLAADKTYTERFLKERRIMSRLNHPNIVTVYDSGVEGSNYFLAMEYLPGGSLKELIRKGTQVGRALDIAEKILSALVEAHNHGFIHRDVKPMNILFREDQTPVLTDFGLAKTDEGGPQLTMPGTAIGSPHYMSPEQIRGQTVDLRADLYGFGIVLYEVLAGKLPYSAESLMTMALMQSSAPVPALASDLAILQPVVNKLLDKDPENRYASAEEALNALKEAVAQVPANVKARTVSVSQAPAPEKPKPDVQQPAKKTEPKAPSKPQPAPRPKPSEPAESAGMPGWLKIVLGVVGVVVLVALGAFIGMQLSSN